MRAERQVLSMVRHPFLCSLFSSFQDEYNLYIVMDYIQGGELFAHIRASAGGLGQDVVRFYGAEIVLALEYLHSFKIVHRDLVRRSHCARMLCSLLISSFSFLRSQRICCWTRGVTFGWWTLDLPRLSRTRPSQSGETIVSCYSLLFLISLSHQRDARVHCGGNHQRPRARSAGGLLVSGSAAV